MREEEDRAIAERKLKAINEDFAHHNPGKASGVRGR